MTPPLQDIRTISLDEALARTWDVVVIGTGMGGGFLGRRLSELGRAVLFVEKGPVAPAAERCGTMAVIVDPRARQMRGFWPTASEARLDGVTTRFFGPYGSGIGGSSVFYSAALEMPARHDLDEDPEVPHPTGGWPVGYDAFRPHFDRAADYLHLCGTADPLSPEPPPKLARPAPLSAADAAMLAQFEAAGLHPYRQHLAIRDPLSCRQCFGTKCPRACKMDGRSAGVLPALATGRAELLPDCAVTEILEDGSRVTGLRVAAGGRDAILTARDYALCAGGIGSPRLLLASRGRSPGGVANSSGWVGRGLMFHVNEFFVVWPRTRGGGGFGRAFSLRDVYAVKGRRFGLVQSVGLDASYGNIVHFLGQVFDQSPLRRLPQLRGLVRIPALIASRLLGKAAVFVGLLEDLPYPGNRVVLNAEDPEIPTFEYTFHPELLKRRRQFRRALWRAFRGQWRLLLTPQPMLNYGHPVGTLRFGTDPATSVLDSDCRTHDLTNLYVADSSFMPSALGVNPSLTIAANALRVAEIIARRQDADTPLQQGQA